MRAVQWKILFAYLNHQNRSARTYVARRGDLVVGYYTLAAGSVSREEAPKRIQGLGRYPVPVILLHGLVWTRAKKGKGSDGAVLKDAILRAAQASDIIGSRAILTHAIDEHAKDFYSRFGFEPSPVNEFHLYLLMKDIQRILASEPGQAAV